MAKEDNKKDDVKKDDRLKALDAALSQIEKQYGKGSDEAGRYFPYAGGDCSDWFFKP